MELKQQVTSLEVSKKLFYLGIKQDSLFMWVKYSLWKEPDIWQSDIAKDIKVTCLSGEREYEYPAYTAGELGEMLKDWIGMEAYFDFKAYHESRGEEDKVDDGRNWHAEEWGIYENSEVELRGRMLIHVIEVEEELLELTK